MLALDPPNSKLNFYKISNGDISDYSLWETHTRVTSFWNENPPVPPNCNALAQESIGILDRML